MGPVDYTVGFALLITGTLATNCTVPPDNPENRTSLVTTSRSSNFDGGYAINDVALFECESKDGFGFVYRRCLGNEMWSAPNRACRDPLPMDSGSISGIVFVAITFIVTTASVIASYKMVPAKGEDMTDLTPDVKADPYRENHVTYQKAATSDNEMVTWVPNSNANAKLEEEPDQEKNSWSDTPKLENNSNNVAV